MRVILIIKQLKYLPLLRVKPRQENGGNTDIPNRAQPKLKVSITDELNGQAINFQSPRFPASSKKTPLFIQRGEPYINYFKTSDIGWPVTPFGKAIPINTEMVGAISGISVRSAVFPFLIPLPKNNKGTWVS